MEELTEEYSLLDELALRNSYAIVARENGQLVYAHTVYHQVLESDYENFITKDDEPMDNLLSEKMLRLLLETLQLMGQPWTDKSFMACANVAVYYESGKFIVPDMFISLDVTHPKDWRDNQNKCYLTWEMGKVPDLVVEVVSNKIGNEDAAKKKLYAKLGVKYYVLYDPDEYLSAKTLRVYELKANKKYVLVRRKHHFMPLVNLGIIEWDGVYEGEDGAWARWSDKDGKVLKTGSEKVAEEQAEKEKEKQRADKEQAEKEKEKQRADKEQAEKEKEKQRADKAEAELQKMQALLESLGVTKE